MQHEEVGTKEETVRQIETAEDVVDQIAKYISSIS